MAKFTPEGSYAFGSSVDEFRQMPPSTDGLKLYELSPFPVSQGGD